MDGFLARKLPPIVSLFCGAGGLDLGFRNEGFRIPVAFDFSEACIRTHRSNFPRSRGIRADLGTIAKREFVDYVRPHIRLGTRIGIIGGPPCQGFSRANTNSIAGDPRNKMPTVYLELIASLQTNYSVDFVVFENVLGMRDPKHAKTYNAFINGLTSLGFDVSEDVLCAFDFGVPQMRRRIVLSAFRSNEEFGRIMPLSREGVKTVREAIGGLGVPRYFARGLGESDMPIHPNHWTMKPRSSRFANPSSTWSLGRSFKRLRWEYPSPTVAFGHREMHVHPDGTRRLSIYEAMLLQGFPSSFVLKGNLSEQVEQVSNAVPPPLAQSIAAAVRTALHRR
jgi:DNA (cytosine-5)-methyltransferase 1